MKIHYIATGDELLDGRVLNTLQHFISQEFTLLGLTLQKASVISDNTDDIRRAVNDHRLEADILLITGGIGPTDDDRTTVSVAAALDLPIIRSKEIETKMINYYQKRGKPFPKSNLKQADFPKGATILENTLGTAPGFMIEKGACLIFVLPGVPREMKALFTKKVINEVKECLPSTLDKVMNKSFYCTGCGESELAQALNSLYPLPAHIHIGFRAKFPETQVLLTCKGRLKREIKNEIDAYQKKIQKLIGKWVFSTENPSFMRHIVSQLKKKKIKLAIAESCTGGLCASLLTQIPGASSCLDLSVVSYSNDAKQFLLQVPKATLAEYGAVSKEVASAMLKGILKITKASSAISITGIAGPDGGTKDKPVGTVFIGIQHGNIKKVKKCLFAGNRDMIRKRAAYEAYRLLLDA